MPAKKQPTGRKKRADGELSRERILAAATEIAAERGYEGTSIGAVSTKCGLPASSIYWHFKDKDDLIAAVIEHSFSNWLAAWQLPTEGDVEERILGVAAQTAEAFKVSPDFIRLGLMLSFERRPDEPRARKKFLQVRNEAFQQFADYLRGAVSGLSDTDIHQLATYAMAGADGLFMTKEIGGDTVDLLALFELHGRSVYDAALRLSRRN